jgi:hypothetical protein
LLPASDPIRRVGAIGIRRPRFEAGCAGPSAQVCSFSDPFDELLADWTLVGPRPRVRFSPNLLQVVRGFDQAAPADAVNAAAFFLTNFCTPRGACPVRVSTSFDIRS